MIILLHSSKTMHTLDANFKADHKPELLDDASKLASSLRKLSISQIMDIMKVSKKLATETKELISSWNTQASSQRTAIDSFAGDIYSGLQIHNWTSKDREYAQQHVRILSGLYGILRPFDGVYPYRWEMGYKLPGNKPKNMYDFWQDRIAATIPALDPIVNLTAAEYGKTITSYIAGERIYAPKFLTISPKTGEPTFVVVHAKIARGAFASWLIRDRVESVDQLQGFTELGYKYDTESSTEHEPVFITKEFGGLGLSVRLHHK